MSTTDIVEIEYLQDSTHVSYLPLEDLAGKLVSYDDAYHLNEGKQRRGK